jgi:hypothetical protein
MESSRSSRVGRVAWTSLAGRRWFRSVSRVAAGSWKMHSQRASDVGVARACKKRPVTKDSREDQRWCMAVDARVRDCGKVQTGNRAKAWIHGWNLGKRSRYVGSPEIGRLNL